MHISKSYGSDLPRTFRRKRSMVNSLAWGTPKVISIEGEDFTLQNAYQDNFLGLKKAFKKLGNAFKKKKEEIKNIDTKGNAVGDLLKKGASAGAGAGATVSKVGKPIGAIVDYGGGATLAAGAITAIAAPAALGIGTKGVAVKGALGTSLKKIAEKVKLPSREILIDKGKELAKDQVKTHLMNIVNPETRSLENTGALKPELALATRNEPLQSQVLQPQILQAGVPLSLENPLMIGGVIILVILLASMFRANG